MIKEFIESLKLKDIVFFVLIIVLFYMVLKKNKKEDFAGQISDANLQAIKNLGDFAAGLKSGGTYKFPGTTLEANSIKIGDFTVNQSYLNTLAKKSEILSTADKTYLTNFLSNGQYEKVKKIGGSKVDLAKAKKRCKDNYRIIASLQDLKDYQPASIQGYGAWASDGKQYDGKNSGNPYGDNSSRYGTGTSMDNHNK